ncbi:MAG TPA: DNA-processing protein DprA [Solirubrobacterales bacterium]|nr:DNA-processing protein DprA [Solirubrobacterales bacterium]
MATLPVSADSQAIALTCSSLALKGDRSLKPLGPAEWHSLSQAVHSAEMRPGELIGLGSEDLQQKLGLEADRAERLALLLARGGQLALEIERLSGLGIWILTRADESYPVLLRKRLGRSAPPLLFGAGPQAGLGNDAIAVVGSRDVDEDGIEFAASLGAACAAQHFAVISGAARGVDATAMMGALERGGAAVGITVDPLERLVRRRDLRQPIADEQLTLATPFHPAARWHVGNAMRRNRLIYALAKAAVVVASSTGKGGTRSGAIENLEASWVPLHVRDDGSAGNRGLIEAGGFPLSPNSPLAEHLQLRELIVEPRPSLLDDSSPSQSTEEPKDDANTRDDAFGAIWPLLERQLREPKGEREVAETLDLKLAQARAWLERAVKEGLAEVKARPKRYSLPGAMDEQLRMEGS